MAARLEDLVLRIDADSRRLRRELARVEGRNNEATRRLRKQWGTVSRTFGVATAKVAGIAGALTALGGGIAFAGINRQVDRFQELADSIDKTALRLGIGTEALQEFRFAASQSGVEARTLDQGLQRFVRRSAEAASGTGEARDAIRELGIQLRGSNGEIRNTEALFTDALRALSDVENQADRLRLAFKLFDSEGVAILQMADRFEELRKEARESGLVIEEGVVQSLVRSKDAAEKLSTQLDQRLSGSLSKLALLNLALKQRFVEGAEAADRLVDESQALNDAFIRMLPPVLIQDLGTMDRALELVRDDMSSVNDQILEFTTQTKFQDDRIRQLNNRLQELIRLESALEDQRSKLQSRPARTPSPASPSPDVSQALELPVASGDRGAAEEARELATAQRELNALLSATQDPADRLLEQMDRLGDSYRAGLISAEQFALGQESLAIMLDRVAEKDLSPLEQALKQVEVVGKAAVGGISASLADFILEGELSLKSFAQSISREFLRLTIQATLLTALKGVGLGGGLGFLATGGPARAGEPYIVGEKGPEIFVPGRSGFVLPNSKVTAPPAARASAAVFGPAPPPAPPVRVAVVVNNHSRSEVDVSERRGPSGEREIQLLITDTIAHDVSRGGRVARAIDQRTGQRPRGA